MKLQKIAFVDVETTGNTPHHDRVIEVGIVLVEDGNITHTFSSLVNPHAPLSPYIAYMTGITEESLATAPDFSDIADKIHTLLKDATFIAHNVHFDYGFIKNELARAGIVYNASYFCTVKLSRFLYPQYTHHNLDALIARHHLDCKNRHRAYDDAHALYQFFNHIYQEFSEEIVDAAISHFEQKTVIPPFMNAENIESLPEGPGVYIFYDKMHIPLYVGKSKNIKTRVKSHFAEIYASRKEIELLEQVHEIETRLTSGELSALLLESALVKQIKPMYNKQLRSMDVCTIIRKKINADGYSTAEIEETNEIEATDCDTVLGIFKSKLKAKSFLQEVKERYMLCAKLLGLEKGSGACFSYNIGNCFGACNAKENSEQYNERFAAAFEKTRLEIWPFTGAIAIEEKTKNHVLHTKHIFDHWIYYGTITWDDDTYTINPKEGIFDYDIYHILKLYFHKTPYKIKKLSEKEFQEFIG